MWLADPGHDLDAAAAAGAALEARELSRSLGSGMDEYRATAWLARHWLFQAHHCLCHTPPEPCVDPLK
jgi:hypothetical protein